MNKRKEPCRAIAVVEEKPTTPEVIEPTALTVKATRMPAIKGKTPGQRINFLHKLSVASGKLSIAAGIMAGWELSRAKGKCEHGLWMNWLAANTEISPTTASRYILVYKETLGKTRAALPEPISEDVAPTAAELNEAAANVDAPTLNGLYSQLKILKHSDNHGGAGRGQGRKPKSKDEAEEVSAQLDAVVNSPALLIASIREPIATVYMAWRERDVFARIDLKDLGQVAATLKELANAANDALKARSKE